MMTVLPRGSMTESGAVFEVNTAETCISTFLGNAFTLLQVVGLGWRKRNGWSAKLVKKMSSKSIRTEWRIGCTDLILRAMSTESVYVVSSARASGPAPAL